MKLNQKGIDLIKSFEKCKLVAYKEKGDRWTIGWGNTYYEDGKPVKKGDKITQEQANSLFLSTLNKTEIGVRSLIKRDLTDDQFSALISFAYNCGLDIDIDSKAEGLGDSTLLKKVNSNPNDPEIKNEFMKWISKGTIFEKGLRNRRFAEVLLYYGKK